MGGVWQETFYDGMTAKSQPVEVRFAASEIVFLDAHGVDHRWLYSKISIEQLSNETRVTMRDEPDAILVLSNASFQVLTEQAPYLRADRQRRRRFVQLIAGLTLAAAAVVVFVFVIVPSAATTLARNTPIETEQQIGANLASQFQLIFRSCQADEAHALLKPIVQDMAETGGIDYDVELTLVRTPLPNAFALPGGQMMATRGFLDAVGDDQEAFWAVIAHELAHVKNRDGMVAMYRNLGLSTLLEIVTGGSGLAQQAVLLGGQLTNLSYTRGQEQSADEAAYDIMTSKSLNPAALGRALSALVAAIVQQDGAEAPASSQEQDWPEWLQTHPDTDKRIERAKARETKRTGALPLSSKEWALIRSACD